MAIGPKVRLPETQARGSRSSDVPYQDRASERAIEQFLDGEGVGIANRPPLFSFTFEDNQSALRLRLESPHVVFLGVEIDLEDDEIVELGLAGQFHQNRILRPAGRAPGREDISTRIDFPSFLAAAKAVASKGFHSAAEGLERSEKRGRSDDGKEESAKAIHLSDPPIKACEGNRAVTRKGTHRFEPL